MNLEKKGIDSIQHTKRQRGKIPMNIVRAIQSIENQLAKEVNQKQHNLTRCTVLMYLSSV